MVVVSPRHGGSSVQCGRYPKMVVAGGREECRWWQVGREGKRGKWHRYGRWNGRKRGKENQLERVSTANRAKVKKYARGISTVAAYGSMRACSHVRPRTAEPVVAKR